MWINRTSGFIELSALAWVTFFQQTSPASTPQPSFLDNPVTAAAFLSLLAGALIHFIPRIAGALVKVIESLAGVVEEFHRNQKAKTDATMQQTAAMKNLFDQLEVERQRANASDNRADKAIEASLSSLTVANSATAQVAVLLTEKQKEIDARKAAEENLLKERERVRVLELQLAAMSAWNANAVAIATAQAEVKAKEAQDNGNPKGDAS